MNESNINNLLLENEQLKTKLKELEHELEVAKKESKALMDACALLNTTLDLQKLLEIILQQSAILTSAEASSLALIDPKTEELCFEVVVGEKKDILKEIRLPKGTGIIGWVSLNGEPLLIEDVTKDSRFYQKVDEKSQFKTKSILCVPLKTKDGTIGALEVLNKLNGEKFDLNDQNLLIALANQAAMAIENARLYKSVLEEKNKIVSIVNSMADGIIVTNENFDIVLSNPAANEVFGNNGSNLENAFKLKVILSELLQIKNNTTFDLVLMKPENIILSNKLTILKGTDNEVSGAIISMRNITDLKHRENIRAQFTTTMNYKVSDEIQDLREYLKGNDIDINSVKNTIESIEEKINKMIQFSEMESGPLRLDRSLGPVRLIVDDIILEMQDKFLSKNINFKLTCKEETLNSEIEVDREKIKNILKLILKNSIKYVSNEGIIELIINDLVDYLQICIKDNGIGIKEEILPKLLDKQYHLENVLTSSEASLSLAYTKHVVEAHGGKIYIKSNIGEGTCVTIELPKFIH